MFYLNLFAILKDVGGREMRVRYSVDMTFRKRNPEALTSSPKKTFIYESPYKLYVGNLIWTTKPEDLRNHFCQFGTVVSARVLHDRKGGNNRVFGFISFSSVAERDAALSMNGTVESHLIAFRPHFLCFCFLLFLLFT